MGGVHPKGKSWHAGGVPLQHPPFVHRAPTGTFVVRVLSEGLPGAAMVTDHRRPVAAYAAARPLGTQATPDGGIEPSCPQGTICVRFDDREQTEGIQAQLR